MAGQNLTLANAILKDVYGDINEQINNETPGLSNIKSTGKNIDKTGGRGIRFVAHVGRNVGIGARNEDEDLPEAGRQQYVDGTTSLKSLYGSIELTGQVMSQASTNYQAFADATDEEVTRIKVDLAKDQNRQFYGDGNGTLASVVTGGAGLTTIEVDDIKYFRTWKGKYVDILEAATLGNPTPTPRNTYRVSVTGYSKANSTITISAATTVGVGDAVVISDRTASGGTNSWGKEWTGLTAMIGTGEVFGIDPATEPEWQSIVTSVASGGNPGPLTEDDLIDFAIDIREAGESPDVFYTTHRVVKNYWTDLQGRRQYVNKVSLDGGMQTPGFESTFGKIGFVADYDAPTGKLFGVNRSKININTNKGWEWIDEDGSKWKMVERRDKYRAYLKSYSELSTYRRNCHGVITDISEA